MEGRTTPRGGGQTRTRNGAARAAAPRLIAAGGAPVPYDDPMSRVLGLDEKTSGFAAWFGFTSGSAILLGGFMALASIVALARAVHDRAQAAPEEIEILRDEPPPPPPEVQPEAKPEPKPEAVAPPPRAVHEPPTPPPAPAQAAKVLTREPDPNDPVDLTGNTIVQGNGDTYAGGFTTSNGTNANAVRSLPAATGAPIASAPPRPAAPAGPDLSRRASLAGGAEWSCPFPPEADQSQIDDAYVVLQIDVGADGSPASVRVTSEQPAGVGFGREAKRCAMAKRYSPALDRAGAAVASTYACRVHFQR